MKIEKISRFDLKKLEKTPIWAERTTLTSPIIVVNSNNEILFGDNSVDSNTNVDGMVECIKIETSDSIESRKIAFQMHYIGMTCEVGFENFNELAISQVGGPYDLYIWNTTQFEKTYNKQKRESPDLDLF